MLMSFASVNKVFERDDVHTVDGVVGHAPWCHTVPSIVSSTTRHV